MNHRLDKLLFLPPRAGTPWSGSPKESTRSEIKRADDQTVAIDLPLFWFDPPWHRIGVETADALAVAVGQLGVVVSAMRSDLAAHDQVSAFHGGDTADDEEGEQEENEQEASHPPSRMVPYRPERYGLSDRDFDGAHIIDLRLSMTRDDSGRFAFSPEQLERWEATPADEPLAGGSWVHAASFPPDVVSIQHLSSKLCQLRGLSPKAAAFVSFGAYRMDEELPEMVAAKPDGLILRLDELDLDGLQLALATRRARQLADHCGAADLPLWIVPGEITPDDAVKLICLGATGVAIDSWCIDVINEAEIQVQQTSRYSSRGPNLEFINELVDDELVARIERFKGLFNSIIFLPDGERLGALDEIWGKALGVNMLGNTSDLE